MDHYTQISEKPNIVYIQPVMVNDNRLEASFYGKNYLDIDEKLIKFPLKSLKEICRKITDGTHKTPNYVDSGVLFLSSKNVLEESIDFSDIKYITKEEHLEISKRCKVEQGDILLTKIGRIGYAKVVPANCEDFSIFVSVALLKINKSESIDKQYIEAFLNSYYGRMQSYRLAKGSNQPDFHLEDIANIQVPIPSAEIQNYIGEKIRKAEILKTKSKELKAHMDHLLYGQILKCIDFPSFEDDSRWISNNELLSERLEAEYYKGEYIYAEKVIKSQIYCSLGEMVEEIQDGPGGWSISTNDYVENGIPIIRGVNVGQEGEFINDGFVYITDEKNKELKKTQVTPGQVLLTVRGTIGRATVMPDYISVANLNAAVVRIKVKEHIVDPYYLAGFFNSKIGRLQTSRIANGAVQLNMNLSEAKSNLVPIPTMDLQKKYREGFLQYLASKQETMKLILEAKNDVESLIEGTFNMSKIKQ